MEGFPRRILRRPDVLNLTGKSSSLLDSEIRAHLFPAPIKLSPDPKRRAVGWPSDEVEKVIAATIAGATGEEMRELVAVLIAARFERAAA